MKAGKMSAGAWTAIIIGIVTALAISGAFGAERDERGAERDERIVVDSNGEGEAVMFLPGLMSSPDVFDAAIGAVQGIEARKVSFAGFAGTPAVAEPDPFLDPVVAALVDELEAAGPAKLVGHSLGGMTALLVAAERPDLVDAVLVVDAVPFLPGLMMPGATPQAAAGQARMMRTQMEAASPAQFEGFVAAGLPRQAAGEESRQMILAAARASDQETAAVAMSELMAQDFSDRLAGLSVPVTVLVPHHDGMGAPAEAVLARYEAQYAGLENVQLRVIEDSRHFVMLDQPAAFADALDDFIKGE